MFRLPIVVIAFSASLAACDRSEARTRSPIADSLAVVRADSIARARQDSINRAKPGYIIDSLLPIEEEIRRFRAAIGGAPVTELSHSHSTRDSLIAAFVSAVERSDTTALRRMAISPREFIDLYYPESPYTHPPYRQAPRLAWSFSEMSSSQGLTRLLARRGGRLLRFAGAACNAKPTQEGHNRLWSGCELVVRSDAGVERREQLFGAIIERDGRFKLMSFANSY